MTHPDPPAEPVRSVQPGKPVQRAQTGRPDQVFGGRRLRVAVVFGGRSSEHAVSCLTAASVLAVLDPDRFDVVPIGITREGQWVLAADPDDPTGPGGTGRIPAAPAATRAHPLPEVDPAGTPLSLAQGGGALALLPAGSPPRSLGPIDVVLPLLHGAFGEDGTLQGLLEMAGVRYVGSGVLASALAMDKAMTKTVLAAAGLPVGRWRTLAAVEAGLDPSILHERVSALGFPLFVKPARAGSSFGVTRVTRPDQLAAAVAEAARHDPKVVVEAAVVGREIECGVLSGPPQAAGQAGPGQPGSGPEVSVCGEIVVDPARDLYDFEAKYLADSGTRLVVPADLEPAVAAAARDLAGRAFTALGCEGLARVDLFLTPDGNLSVNEVNTMPGFTPMSMFPRVWQASGLDYASLVTRLVDTAAVRPLGLR